MTPIEKKIPIIVKALLEIPEGPWFVSFDEAKDTTCHKDSGLAKVDTGRTEDWPIARLCEWDSAKFIAASPLWLASLVVEIVKEREKQYMHTGDHRKDMSWDAANYQALRDFSISPSDYKEIKRKVEG